jgi:hypothetical protein
MTPDLRIGQAPIEELRSQSLLHKMELDIVNCLSVQSISADLKKTLITGFREDLSRERKFLVSCIVPGADTYDVAKAIKGNDFISMSPEDRINTITQIDSIPPNKRGSLVNETVSKLYKEYESSDSSVAWEKFVKAYKLFNVNSKKTHDFSGNFPYFDINDHTKIILPFIPDNNRPVDSRLCLLENTLIQTELSRSIGILNKDETWPEFIRRPNIRVMINDRYPASDLRIVLCEMKESGIKWWELVNVPTKYPGVKSRITFDRNQYVSISNESLDFKIENGELSPKIELKISVAAFVS